MRWLQSILTDDQWDADGVLLAILGTILFMCWQQYGQPFDPEKFGQGIGYVLGGGGLGYCAKRIGEKKYGPGDDSSIPKE